MTSDEKTELGIPSDLFPLPLTSVERFHLLDQTVKFPNTVCSRLEFDGVIDPVLAEQTTLVALHRHPILGSVIEHQNGRLLWRFAPESRLPERWNLPWSESPGFPKPDSSGIQFVSRSSDANSVLWIQSNHVLCDGVGATSFIGDWIKIYHNLYVGNSATHKLRKLDYGLLKTRNEIGLLKKKSRGKLWKQPVGLYGTAKFLLRKVAEMNPDGNAERDAERNADWNYEEQPSLISCWLEQETCNSLSSVAQDKNVTVNTYMLAQFYLHLADWLQQHCPEQAAKWLRIIHPFNLRDYSHRRMPATNRVAIVQIDRRQQDLADFDRSLQGLDREIKIINDWELGKLFLLAIRSMSVIPGMLKRSAQNKKCRGTCVFTSLPETLSRSGLPVEQHSDSSEARLQVGNLKLDSIDYIGPVRHGTPVNLIVLKHLGRLRFSFHYDPRILSRAAADEFLSTYADRLRSGVSK